MRKITKRDVLVFILGMLTYLFIEIVYDWEGSKTSFMKGWNGTASIEPRR